MDFLMLILYLLWDHELCFKHQPNMCFGSSIMLCWAATPLTELDLTDIALADLCDLLGKAEEAPIFTRTRIIRVLSL
ncbi:hypothetical protein PVK06_019711 [Gossypium arboreum]|uniref:Uncharacterized protein n=1 Tax=Gossypium arboreum TaxID=29729 RepID=A0ABR0PKJ1_GOSAR|nr:hypothetical protein PVK06_019711 [Gossypium arboreum]